MASALQFYFRHDDSALALDNEDFLNTLLEDLYTAETITGASIMKRVVEISLPANKNTNSTSFILMPDSAFVHTPSKPKMSVKCFNLNITNTGAAITEVEIRFNDIFGMSANAKNLGATARSMTAAALFEDLEIGVEHEISLYWRVSGGTGGIFFNSVLVFEIEEYD